MLIDIVKREAPIQINKGHEFASCVTSLEATARQGEEYAFQIAVLAEEKIESLTLAFADIQGKNGVISADDFFCINFGGIDYKGNPFTKKISLEKGDTQVLWVSVRIPEDANGEYNGNLYVFADDKKTVVPLKISVTDEKAVAHGHNEPKLFTRLSWLNSTLAEEHEPTKDYPSPKRNCNVISILGRDIVIGRDGFPEKIVSHFDYDIKVSDKSETVAENIGMEIVDSNGNIIPFRPKAPEFTDDNEGISWVCNLENDLFKLRINGRAEFDGYIDVVPVLTAKKDCELNDISIKIPYIEKFAKYAMGLGNKGGYAPEVLDYKWDATKHQNPIWFGNITGGIRCEFRGEDFVEPFVNIYYRHRPYHMAKSFCNDGNGGVKTERKDGYCILSAYGGKRSVKAGEQLDFSFDMLVTPFKEFNPKKRFGVRYYHRGDASNSNVAEAKSVGANYMNIHHASTFNPYINHPFVKNAELKALIDEAHAAGIKLKVYYTVREQSDGTSELQALRSLGTEIFPKPTEGQGSILWNSENLKWFAENIGTDVIPAWKSDVDASVISDGQSRMCNYYIEGLNWLVKNQDIDGIYIDDVAYDRITMRRARRVLDQKRDCLVDLHTWNHFCDLAGYGNSVNIYMPLLPYIDSIWIGEGFNHDGSGEDYWLVEMMGLPYGMSAEILPSSDKNQYRGMLFGVTTRYPWCGGSPKPIWDFIAEHDLANSVMHGFWNPESPVKTDDDNIRATVWIGEKEVVIAVASWASEAKDVTVSLNVDGFDIKNAEIPAIENYQEAEPFTGKIHLEPVMGKLLVIKK